MQIRKAKPSHELESARIYRDIPVRPASRRNAGWTSALLCAWPEIIFANRTEWSKIRLEGKWIRSMLRSNICTHLVLQHTVHSCFDKAFNDHDRRVHAGPALIRPCFWPAGFEGSAVCLLCQAGTYSTGSGDGCMICCCPGAVVSALICQWATACGSGAASSGSCSLCLAGTYSSAAGECHIWLCYSSHPSSRLLILKNAHLLAPLTGTVYRDLFVFSRGFANSTMYPCLRAISIWH
jgi:hypothetical protein